MRGSRWLAAVVAVGSISTGVAIAGSSSKSETSPVMGKFEANLVGHPKPKRCAAKHEKVKLRFEGTQQSDDARLAGRLEIQAVAVVNTDPKSDGYRYGYAKGTVVLRKTYSPGKTFEGEFVAVLEPDGGGEGFMTGETRGKDAVHLLANFNFDMDSPGHISGEFGQDTQVQKPYAPTEDQDPAIVTNACFDRGHGHGHGHGTEAATANPPGPRRRRVAGVSLAMTRPARPVRRGARRAARPSPSAVRTPRAGPRARPAAGEPQRGERGRLDRELGCAGGCQPAGALRRIVLVAEALRRGDRQRLRGGRSASAPATRARRRPRRRSARRCPRSSHGPMTGASAAASRRSISSPTATAATSLGVGRARPTAPRRGGDHGSALAAARSR